MRRERGRVRFSSTNEEWPRLLRGLASRNPTALAWRWWLCLPSQFFGRGAFQPYTGCADMRAVIVDHGNVAEQFDSMAVRVENVDSLVFATAPVTVRLHE